MALHKLAGMTGKGSVRLYKTFAEKAGQCIGKRLRNTAFAQRTAQSAGRIMSRAGQLSHLPESSLMGLEAGKFELALPAVLPEEISPTLARRILSLAREAGRNPAEKVALARVLAGIKRVYSAFKAYDIRGDKITGEEIFWISRGFAEEFNKGDTLIFGHDIREVTSFQTPAAIEAARQAGLNVIDIGEVGTGVLKWYALRTYLRGDAEGGVQNTGSHTVPETVCGLKLVKHGRPFSRGEIQNGLRNRVLKAEFKPKAKQRGSLKKINIMEEYREFLCYVTLRTMGHDGAEIREILASPEKLGQTLKDMPLFMDGGFGAMGPFIIDTLRSLGADVEAVNIEPNGAKMAEHILDPNVGKEADRLAGPLLIEANMRTREAGQPERTGIVMDPDRDRGDLMYENGRTIPAGEFLMIHAGAMADNPEMLGKKVVLDVRAPVALRAFLSKLCLETVISAAGYSFILDEMELSEARFGSEMTFHTMTTWTPDYMRFKGEQIKRDPDKASFIGFDDAPTSVFMALAILKKAEKRPSEFVQALYERHGLAKTSADEVRIQLTEDEKIKTGIVNRVNQRFREAGVIRGILLGGAPQGYSVVDEVETIDGSKVIFRDAQGEMAGSFLTRMSNTGPQNCLTPEVKEGEQEAAFAKRMTVVWALENLLAAQNHGLDIDVILDSGDPQKAPEGKRITTFDFDFTALLRAAEQYDDYESLREVLRKRV
jgi:phosphomannomutase